MLVAGRFSSLQNLLVLGCFKSYFMVVSCHCKLFLPHYRLFQIVRVVSGCFLLVVGSFRSSFACCGLFQVVSACCLLLAGRFISFQVVLFCIKYRLQKQFSKMCSTCKVQMLIRRKMDYKCG